MSNKPVILETDGVLGQLSNGAIINAGGTSHPSWTVNGVGVLLADGSSTAGGPSTITLQTVYNNTPAVAGEARIQLTTGKDLVIADDTNSSLFFKVDAETGKVTITGDLEVLGSSTIIDTVVQNSDHWQISPKSGTTSALRIEPDLGVIPIVDIVSVRRTFATAPVFKIDAAGNLTATQNLTVGGLINGVDIIAVKNDLENHLMGTPGFRHLADDIDILPIASLPGATNVQQALEQINAKADTGGGGSGNVRGYEHIQVIPSTSWTITHNMASFRSQTTVYDTNWEQIIAESVKIIDNNTILVTFGSAIAGRAMVVLF